MIALKRAYDWPHGRMARGSWWNGCGHVASRKRSSVSTPG